MIATDELRRLLDERGAEWWEEDGHTLWYGESIHHAASAFSSFMFGENDKVHLSAMVTPEQAIAATLGAGTCQVETTENWLPAERYHRCNHCGAFFAVLDASGDIPPHCCPNCGRKVVDE